MEKRKVRQTEEKFEVSAEGKPYVKGTHVEFTYKRHKFTGIIEKQLRNSAIIVFDTEFADSYIALELKHRIVISYAKMKIIVA